MRGAIIAALIGCCLVSPTRSAEDAPTTMRDEETTTWATTDAAATTGSPEEEVTTAAIATSAEAETPKHVPVDLLDPNIALARVARDTYGGWQGSWTRNQDPASPNRGFGDLEQNQGFGSPYRDREFGYSDRNQGFGNAYRNKDFDNSDRNQGFGNAYRNKEFGNSDRNQGFGNAYQNKEFSGPGKNQGFGNSHENQRYGSPYERKPFGIDNYYRLIRPTSPEPARRRNDVPRIPATRKPFRVYPVFPG